MSDFNRTGVFSYLVLERRRVFTVVDMMGSDNTGGCYVQLGAGLSICPFSTFTSVAQFADVSGRPIELSIGPRTFGVAGRLRVPIATLCVAAVSPGDFAAFLAIAQTPRWVQSLYTARIGLPLVVRWGTRWLW